MAKPTYIMPSIVRTSSGSIDYQYYDHRAKDLRGLTVWILVKGLLSGKKFSRAKKASEGIL